jgi:ectoine hydroxylase-related dioxygenase (phytanoyl-CoA dioxygenase family)
MKDLLAENGFQIVQGLVCQPECRLLGEVLGKVSSGRRALLGIPEVANLAFGRSVLAHVEAHLGTGSFPVRSLFFDKTLESNWAVAWHQDLTIATRMKIEVPGFGPWTEKNQIPHVQPPHSLLERMLTVRIHLDTADEGNGALRVVPGSHRLGRIAAGDVHHLRTQMGERLCCAEVGDALLMKPLILHGSHKSTSSKRRRILHIEYSNVQLPDGLEWNDLA